MPRTPNTRLRHLLDECGWSAAQLAAAIRIVTAEQRHPLTCDRSTVWRWLEGARPRPLAATCLLEALSRRLGRTVTPYDAGLTRAPAVWPGPSFDADPLRRLVDLARGELDPGRRMLQGSDVYRLTGLSVPGWHELGTSPRHQATPSPVRVGRAEVTALRTMIAVSSGAVATLGGGHGRAALAACLVYDVAPWLSATATEAVHEQLLSAAAQLAVLAGNMCADDHADALAQQYHRAGAGLAAEARDAATHTIALRAMATHAHELGHHRPARALAQQAADTARHHTPRIIRSYTQAQLAVAEADTRNPRAARTALEEAERLYTQADQIPGPFTSYPHSALQYQRAHTLAALGDHTGAARALTASLHERPTHHHRARMLVTARLAETFLHQGQLEPALTHWHTFAKGYPDLHSAYALYRLTTMRQLLRPHRRHPTAALLLAETTHFH
ncbi:tetratricopeptide repeat protein [Streptomyces tsukubensis]